MNLTLKSKIIMFISLIIFMAFYTILFGNKNAVIGIIIILAAFMNLGNDLSFKYIRSFIKVLLLLLILGVTSFLNNPLTIWGCLLTFIVVFGTTFTSYHMFGTNVYLPYLMCYFMMVAVPVTIDELPMRLLSLIFGAIFIVGLNIIVNRKKTYTLSKTTVFRLFDELNNAVDLKLDGKEVSSKSFKTAEGFYSSILNRFEYKYFPTKQQEAVLNVVKSFQYIGIIIADSDFSFNELNHVKKILSQIHEINMDNIYDGIEIKSKEMYLVLLNLEIIAKWIKNVNLTKFYIPDKKTVISLFKPIIKNQFSFKSPKFIFAFKRAFILFAWQILTLLFNLPFTKWLYFVTIPLMIPYVDDLKYVAKSRIKGTFAGVFLFSILIIAMHYIPVNSILILMVVIIVCMFVMVVKLDDKVISTTATTVMSVMSALIYIKPPEAVILKVLWVVVGVSVVSLFNFKFLPYSVDKETKNNLNVCYELNKNSIEMIKEKCLDESPDNKITLLVISNIVRENIEITCENKIVYDLQIKITDICNFIVTYLDFHETSDDLKNNLIGIIDNDEDIYDNLDVRDKVIAYSVKYVISLYKKENEIMESVNYG